MEIYIKKTKCRGVTLIELLVAVAIFSIFIAAIFGLLISSLQVQRRILASQELLSQASYAVEYMGRALRMAVKDGTGGCLTSVGQKHNYETDGGRIRFLKFDTAINTDICQELFFLNDTLYEKKSNDKTANFSTALPLTSANIKVISFKINISGDDPNENPNLQPRVTIFLELESKTKSMGQPRVKVQTSVSQRNLDVQI